MSWQPTLGAWLTADGTRFRVWAPPARRVEVIPWVSGRYLTEAGTVLRERDADGCFQGVSAHFGRGDRYGYRVDGAGPFPDPASRFQPEGVHGPSEIVDPASYRWSDAAWAGIGRDELILYELHVGTCSPEGTFAGLGDRLEHLVRFGVNAIELMPVADFPGRWNWGYDGVALFAPARCYGTPDDLRRLVNRAHRLGLAVLLDVVYNHFGPDGSYLGRFSPLYLSERHRTPWGPAVNLDGRGSAMVRGFFIENALHWIHEYHIDGLRLDATHAIVDESPLPFLAELSDRVHASVESRPVHLIAEDHRNLAVMLRPRGEGGWGLDGVWSDDFHHQLRRLLAGDADGVYRDFRGSIPDLVTTLNDGWLFRGEYSRHRGRPRGTDPSGIPPRRFIFFLQNHDRVGNRAFGERLHHQIDPAAYRAAVALLLCAPQTPLLFMGQEWAASSPFLFFTDHHPELGQKVRGGRLREFASYAAFRDPAIIARIPDPQAESTFRASRLDWSEIESEEHAAILRLYSALLRLRKIEPALEPGQQGTCQARALDEVTMLLRYAPDGVPALMLVARLRGAGTARLPLESPYEVILTTEDPDFATDLEPLGMDRSGDEIVIVFPRPAAVLLRGHSG